MVISDHHHPAVESALEAKGIPLEDRLYRIADDGTVIPGTAGMYEVLGGFPKVSDLAPV